MKYSLRSLAIETTRKCNLKCEHCMRGVSQNVDMPKEYIDYILNKLNIIHIEEILFSGGEPTLNPELIVYTIDKIISEGLSVGSIKMVTNGQIFSKEIVDAFNRFNQYANKNKEIYLKKIGFSDEIYQQLLRGNLNKNVRIIFSTDKYHKYIADEVKEKYKEYSIGLNISEHAVRDEDIIKTGNANIGNKFDYSLNSIEYNQYDSESCYIWSQLYLTSKGDITSEPNGTYVDMDSKNFGNIMNLSFFDLLINYGEPVLGSSKISIDTSSTKK